MVDFFFHSEQGTTAPLPKPAPAVPSDGIKIQIFDYVQFTPNDSDNQTQRARGWVIQVEGDHCIVQLDSAEVFPTPILQVSINRLRLISPPRVKIRNNTSLIFSMGPKSATIPIVIDGDPRDGSYICIKRKDCCWSTGHSLNKDEIKFLLDNLPLSYEYSD